MGCGSSFSTLPSIKSNKTSNARTTANTTTNKSNKLPPINSERKATGVQEKRDKNLEPFTLICLDEHFSENDKQIRSILDYVCCFNDIDECETYIKDINKSNFIFFIVSSEHFNSIVSHIHDLSQVIAIYVLKNNERSYSKKENVDKHWTKRYTKVMQNNFKFF